MVIIVSHDRVFLDEVSTDSLHISGYARQLTQTRGNYSTWHKRREQQQLTFGRDMDVKTREYKELRDWNPGILGSTPKAMKIYQMKQKQADKREEEIASLQVLIALAFTLTLTFTRHSSLVTRHPLPEPEASTRSLDPKPQLEASTRSLNPHPHPNLDPDPIPPRLQLQLQPQSQPQP